MTAVVTANPATGETLAEYATFSGAEVDAALDRAAEAQCAWAARSIEERAVVLHRVAALLREQADVLALLITREMGKPLVEARAEVEKCATTCDYYADHAAAFLADEHVATSADRSWISYEPVGVVLAVMPWNFPLWQVLRFAAPALMAGNGALLKHSPNTTGCALAVQRVVAEAGAPGGLFGALVVAEPDVPAVTQRLIADPRVGAVTITGSERAGRAVGAAAGGAIKKSVLELGGSDPFVVLADADLPRVAAMAARGRLMNAGQSCISPKRLVVDASVAEEFPRLLVAEVEALVVGDPEDAGTHVGPMARADLRDGVHRQVEASVAAGATVLTGGRPLPRPGCFYAPTVLADVAPGMPAYDEEVFGPVAAVVVAADEDDAVRIANDTRFGLGASVWTTDPDRGIAVARAIRSGAAFVNALVASDARMPFGGTGGERLRPGTGRRRHPGVRARPHLVGPRRARRHGSGLGVSAVTTYRLGMLLGDGIGPEIVPAAVRVVDAALAAAGAGPVAWRELPLGAAAIETHGSAIPESTMSALVELDGWLLGPHDSAAYPEPFRSRLNPSGAIRKHFDLYANIRPARSFEGGRAIAPATDLVVVRENTQGFYADRSTYAGTGEFMPAPDVAIAMGVFTRPAIDRIARTALELARRRRSRLTIVHKANVLPMTSGMFKRVCLEVADGYPDVQVDDVHMDAMTVHLLRRASSFDVVVAENMFGDILSDMAGELAGSLGIAPSINASDDRCMAQAAHGSAPDIAGKGLANPIAMIESAGMLLDWLGSRHDDARAADAAVRLHAGVRAVVRSGVSTRDLGGTASTDEFTQAVVASVAGA